MARDRKGMGCLGKTLISLLVIVVVIVVAAVAILHLTPNHFKLGDLQIAGTSLNELGLGDAKFIDIIKSFMSLKKPDVEAIVTNPPGDEDKSSAASKVETGSSIPMDTDGSPDFSTIVTDPVVYDKEYLITYSDKELAGLFGHIIDDAEDKADTPEAIQFLADLNATIASITISDKQDDGSASIRIVASVNISHMREEIAGGLPDFLKNQIPETVYIAFYGKITANVVGDLVYTHVDALINDKDDVMSKAIFKVVAGRADIDEGQDPKVAIGNKVGEGFEILIGNLGKIGTAETDFDGVVEAGTKVLGKIGIQNGKISLITMTE